MTRVLRQYGAIYYWRTGTQWRAALQATCTTQHVLRIQSKNAGLSMTRARYSRLNYYEYSYAGPAFLGGPATTCPTTPPPPTCKVNRQEQEARQGQWRMVTIAPNAVALHC